MARPVNILVVEDSEDNLLLLLRALKAAGWEVDHERVETAGTMREALSRRPWDCVVSDFTMPHFSALGALSVLHESGLDLPFIVASGTIGEESAVEALKAGAHDFLVKGRFARLGPAIERELREAANRRDLRSAREALERSAKLRTLGLMAAGVSHDLRNILTPLSMYLQVVKAAVEKSSWDFVAESIDDAELVLKRGTDLLERLRAFSRQDPGSRPNLVDLDELAREAVSIARPRMASSTRAMGSIVEELTAPPPVAAKADELVAAIVNLLVNAIDALPRAGRITVRSGQARGGVWISVGDNGAGMTEEIRARVFEPFFTTKGDEGTGLGLAMVYATMQRHSGEVTIESTPQKGTTATLWLPRGTPDPVPPHATAGRSQPGRG